MMSFEEPAYLHLAWALPALAAAYWARRRAAAGEGRCAALLSGLRRALRLMAGAALVLALANPLPRPLANSAAGAAPSRLVFLLDVSNSMLAGDALPDRLTQAKKVVAEAVRGLQGQEVGLVVFAGTAQLYLPLTTDYEVVGQACASITPRLVARQGTSLAEALTMAALVLKPSPRHRQVACVLSDGESHTGRTAELADSLQRAGIDLFAIGIGTLEGAALYTKDEATGELSPKRDRQGQAIVSRLHTASLRRIVQGGAGRYIRLDTWGQATAELLQGLRQLAPGASPPERPGEVASFQWCLLAAVLLLGAELLLPRGALFGTKL